MVAFSSNQSNTKTGKEVSGDESLAYKALDLKHKHQLGMVLHTHNPSTEGLKGQRKTSPVKEGRESMNVCQLSLIFMHGQVSLHDSGQP